MERKQREIDFRNHMKLMAIKYENSLIKKKGDIFGFKKAFY